MKSYKNYWIDRRKALFRQFIWESIRARWSHVFSLKLVEAVVADLESLYDDLNEVDESAVDVAVALAQV